MSMALAPPAVLRFGLGRVVTKSGPREVRRMDVALRLRKPCGKQDVVHLVVQVGQILYGDGLVGVGIQIRGDIVAADVDGGLSRRVEPRRSARLRGLPGLGRAPRKHRYESDAMHDTTSSTSPVLLHVSTRRPRFSEPSASRKRTCDTCGSTKKNGVFSNTTRLVSRRAARSACPSLPSAPFAETPYTCSPPTCCVRR